MMFFPVTYQKTEKNFIFARITAKQGKPLMFMHMKEEKRTVLQKMLKARFLCLLQTAKAPFI